MSEEEIDDQLKFPSEYWVIFNAKFSVQPIIQDDQEIFRRYQLINQSDGTKYGNPMDLMEMITFLNQSYQEYQKELEKIILG